MTVLVAKAATTLASRNETDALLVAELATVLSPA